jgi:RNA polymerase sigma-70 factor (ECF subfamily)
VSPSLSTDAALLEGLRARDPAALERLYEQYSQILYAVIVRILRDETESEDVLQDVFLQAWNQADRYTEKRGTLKAWLVMMGRSRAVDRVRSMESAKRTKEALAEVEPLLDNHADRPEEAADLGERRSLIRKAIEGLGREQRQVLELSFYRGMSHSEISEQLGRPLGTVKTQMRTALHSLRGAFRNLREEISNK